MARYADDDKAERRAQREITTLEPSLSEIARERAKPFRGISNFIRRAVIEKLERDRAVKKGRYV